MEQKLYGGIELGGTKTICVIADAGGNISAQTTIPTTTVDETLTAVQQFFQDNQSVVAVGVGSFGPLQLNPASPDFGHIYNSPKPGWLKVDIKGSLEDKLGLPVAIDTDVNCAALGELNYGVASDARNFVYLTLGTGVGGSLIRNGEIFNGILNLEMGHVRVPHEPFTDSFKGVCIFHGDCLEGIASGPAMEQRYGQNPENITDEQIWKIEAGYIASAINNLMMTVGPELVVVGGGLTNHEGLISTIRGEVNELVNGYLDFPDLEKYIVQSSGTLNGALGAIKLASLAGSIKNNRI